MNNKLRIINGSDDNERLYTIEEMNKFQQSLISGWELQQRAVGYTEESIALNLRNIKEFLELIDKYIWDITPEDVDKFYANLVGRNLAHSTRRKYQSNISTFLDYLRTRKSLEIYQKIGVTVPDVFDQFNKIFHRRDDNDIKVVPPKKEIVDIFFDFLIEEMKYSRKYKTVARDYVFFKLLGLLGIRINELTMVDVSDVRFDLGTTEIGKINIRYGKGSRGTGPKQRWVPLINGSRKLLEWYLKNVHVLFNGNYENEIPLFLTESGDRVTRDAMRANLARREKKAGIPESERFSAHQLRHAFATDLAGRGVDILTISKLLGHSNIATTAGYLDASSDYIEKRIKVAQRKWKQELLELEDE